MHNRPRFAPILVALLARTSATGPAPASPAVEFQDDRRAPVLEPVKVCFYRGLETACVEAPPYVVPAALQDFDSLTAEGPHHGPVVLKRADLVGAMVGGYAVTIPRKSRLDVTGTPIGTALSLSLYSRADQSFRKPAFRFEHVDSPVWVPAGDFVVSLTDGEHAPDLQFLPSRPGEKETLGFHARDGWSLIVRCVDAKGGAVTRALVGLTSPGTGSKALALGSTKTSTDGLGILNGVAQLWVTLSAAGDNFLPLQTPGVAAAVRTVAFREIEMLRGGNVRATVTIAGEPAVGAKCELVDSRGKDQPGGRIPTSEVLAEATVGRNGICETPRLKPGGYIFRVTPPGADNGEDDAVTLAEDSTTEMEEKLGRYEIRGTVKRGEDPAPGMFVVAMNELDIVAVSTVGGRTAPPAWLRVRTGSDGSYRGQVFRRGTYTVMASDEAWTLLAKREKVAVGADGAAVDFQLNSAEVSGVVVDQHGDPVGGAQTTLKLIESDGETYRPGATDASGHFTFSLEGAANVEVIAKKGGYRGSDPFPLNIVPDAEIPPITLVLKKLDSVTGHVVDSSGSPVPGVHVLAYGTVPGLPPTEVGSTETDGDGAFSVAAAPGGASRLFVTGAQCALQITDVGNDGEDHVLRCSEVSSALEASLRKANGAPVEFDGFRLVWEGRLIPREVLLEQAESFGTSPVSDGSGRLTIVGLPPGEYGIYLMSGSNEALISGGQKYGFVSDLRLDALQTAELEVQVP
jgi:hypothetical protein